MESTDRTVEALMVLVDDGFESILKLLVGILELVVLIGKTERALIHELQGDLDRNAVV